ncbi:unnamed protein product [Closterium sp. Naga37s-1]|nr:unnamed protein product [Closterium sp. Naga37s-1]
MLLSDSTTVDRICLQSFSSSAPLHNSAESESGLIAGAETEGREGRDVGGSAGREVGAEGARARDREGEVREERKGAGGGERGEGGAGGEDVVIAIGGNIGNRVANFHRALQMLREAGVQVHKHGCLYESAPAYVTDHASPTPPFPFSPFAAGRGAGAQAWLSVHKHGCLYESAPAYVTDHASPAPPFPFSPFAAGRGAGAQAWLSAGVQVHKHGCLYESAPAYVTDQPSPAPPFPFSPFAAGRGAGAQAWLSLQVTTHALLTPPPQSFPQHPPPPLQAGVQVHKHGCLYESAPAYVTDQPSPAPPFPFSPFAAGRGAGAQAWLPTHLSPPPTRSSLSSSQSSQPSEETSTALRSPLRPTSFFPPLHPFFSPLQARTTLPPHALLSLLKSIESTLRRDLNRSSLTASAHIILSPSPSILLPIAGPHDPPSPRAALSPQVNRVNPWEEPQPSHCPTSTRVTSSPASLPPPSFMSPPPFLSPHCRRAPPSPHALLSLLKSIESTLGRNLNPLTTPTSPLLFVLAPVADLLGSAQAEDEEEAPSWVFHEAFGKEGVQGTPLRFHFPLHVEREDNEFEEVSSWVFHEAFGKEGVPGLFVLAPVIDLLGSAQAEDEEEAPSWVFHQAFGKDGVPAGVRVSEVPSEALADSLWWMVDEVPAGVGSAQHLRSKPLDERLSLWTVLLGSAQHLSSSIPPNPPTCSLWRNLGGEAAVGGTDLRRVVPLAQRLFRGQSAGRKEEGEGPLPGATGDAKRLSHLESFGVDVEAAVREAERMVAEGADIIDIGGQSTRPGATGDAKRLSHLESFGVDVEAAVREAERMVAEGADIIDIGGQSTRPGATRLSTNEELTRVIPVIQAVRSRSPDVIISVDTFDAEVARSAALAGADVINDVSGGTMDPQMLPTVAALNLSFVLMHMRGDPTTMQSSENTTYKDLIADVASELACQVAAAERAGISLWNIILDPGIGFAKTGQQNLELIRNLGQLRKELGRCRKGLEHVPLLLGPSRKGFLGRLTGRAAGKDRDWATCGAVAACVAGGADVIRVHNVAAGRDASVVAAAIFRNPVFTC